MNRSNQLSRKRKRWLPVIVVVLAVGLGYAVYSLVIHTGVDYLTVSELKSQAESLQSQQVRVGGKIAPGSIEWDSGSQTLRFVLADDEESLAVVFQGITPDEFKPGAELIVEGKYRTDGVLEATSFGSRRSVCSLCH